jgi:hypothetical protein
MTFYLVGEHIYDENLRLLTSLPKSVLGDVRDMFVPLSRYEAQRFLDTLWEETYSLSRGSVPKGEVRTYKRWAEATYAWHMRIIMQTTLCPLSCPKKPPHVHVTEERIKKLVKRHQSYARSVSLRNHLLNAKPKA